jgi:protein O-mannosyl-transferase
VKRPLAILVLVFAVIASYVPALRNGFVWDDTALVLRDPLIRSWRLIPEHFNHFLFLDATASDFYRPIQRLTYTFEYAFFTVRPGPYHLTNILLHAGAVVALLFFAEALLGAFGMEDKKRRWIALIAALVWAIHPVQSAAVIYISGRADPLAALFGFTGCYLVLSGLRSQSRGVPFLLFGSGIAFFLSALSKETGLIFPFLMLVLLGLLKQRRAAVHLAIIILFVGVSYLSLRLPAEHNPPPKLGPSSPLSLRPITMLRAVTEYAGLVLLPINLHMDRTVQAPLGSDPAANMSPVAWRELQTLAGVILIAAALYCAIRIRKRDPLMLALIVLTSLSYLPVSGILPLNASVAEHWIYVPTAFFFLGAVVAIWKRLEGFGAALIFSRAIVTAFAVWMLFLGTRTFFRTFDWKDQRTFLTQTIAAGGDSARMLINLGGLELSENRLDLARQHLEAALKMEPDQPFAVINLATVALKQNDFRRSRDLLMHATRLPLVDAQAHELLTVLENKESGGTDLLRLRLAAHTGISNWSIEKRYVKLLAETGATGSAIQELQNCLHTEWYRAESWQLLAQLLSKSGRAKEAEKAFAYANSYDVHLAARPEPL